MRKYIKSNKRVLDFINDKKHKIIEIRPVKKRKRQGIQYFTHITSYCIIYEKML